MPSAIPQSSEEFLRGGMFGAVNGSWYVFLPLTVIKASVDTMLQELSLIATVWRSNSVFHDVMLVI
jgi:hypothetical protein